jgi:hypothetical protein
MYEKAASYLQQRYQQCKCSGVYVLTREVHAFVGLLRERGLIGAGSSKDGNPPTTKDTFLMLL